MPNHEPWRDWEKANTTGVNRARRQEANEPGSLIRLALDDFNRALNIDPDDHDDTWHELLRWRAWTHYVMGDFELCVADCDTGLVEHPKRVPLLRIRGDAMVEQRQFRLALDDYDTIARVSVFENKMDKGKTTVFIYIYMRQRCVIYPWFVRILC